MIRDVFALVTMTLASTDNVNVEKESTSLVLIRIGRNESVVVTSNSLDTMNSFALEFNLLCVSRRFGEFFAFTIQCGYTHVGIKE